MTAAASRIAASSHGESRFRVLRVVRRGDRHDPRDLTVSFRFEGEPDTAFTDGETPGLLPGETVKRLVHSMAREHGAREIETLGLALAAEVLRRQPKVTRVRVELSEQSWQRLEAGGKAQAQAFVRGSGERRTAVVTSNGRQISVVAGIQHLSIMRSAGFAPSRANADDGSTDGLPRLVVGELSARWTYTTGDVAFDPYRHGVRKALLETIAWHSSRSVQHALYAAGDVILSSFEEIADVTLAFHEHPYRPADPFAAGEAPDDLFIAIDEPVASVEVTVERSSSPNI